MLKHEEFAFISGILSITAFSFLIYEIHITKNTDSLTFIWIFLILVAQSLMFMYGKLNHIQGLYIPATIFLIGMLYILYVKVVYKETKKIEDELRDKSIIINNK
jgi:ACR3 family arsenite efflux pump ArsB